jgi:hypothetical protein
MSNMMNNCLVVVFRGRVAGNSYMQMTLTTYVDLNRGWIGLQSSTAPQARGHNPHQGGRNWRAA